MSQKFSIVIEIKEGKPVSTAYLKVNALDAVNHFTNLRNEGREAYLFQHPIADRRCKSTEQVNATLGERDENGKPKSAPAENVVVPDWKKNEIVNPVKKKRGGNKIEGLSLDGEPSAVDME